MDNHKVAANDVVGPCVFRSRPDKSLVIAAMLVQKGSEELVNNNERACIHVYH